MPNVEASVKKAIDEVIAPLISDHRTFLADTFTPFLPVSRADLHYVFDQYGSQMLDFSAILAPVGHNHPKVVNTIHEHLRYYIRTADVGRHVLRWPVEFAAKLSRTFVDEDAVDFPQVQFTEGEREAVLLALRLSNSGPHFAMLDTDQYDWVSTIVSHSIPLVPLGAPPESFRNWDQIDVLLISLVCADGRVVDPEWLRSVVDLARSRGVQIIVDESRTGFGRLGTMWGQQTYGITPDLTILGGPLGGGLALGAVVGSAELFGSSSAPWSVSPQAGSPVACAAGAGVLDAVNPGVLEHVKDASITVEEALKEVTNQFTEYLVTTGGKGLWQFLEFHTAELANRFVFDALRRGLLLAPAVDECVVLTPTLIASEAELKRGVDLLAATLLDWSTADNP